MLFHWDLTSKFPNQGINSAGCFVGVNIELSDAYSIINLDAWECQNEILYSSFFQHMPMFYPTLNSMSFEKTH